MSSKSPQDITGLLALWREGDAHAEAALMDAIYPSFKRIAGSNLRKLGPNLTLSATELVHEAYLRMESQRRTEFSNSEHLLAVATMLMRRAAIDYLRGKQAEKRGAGESISSLDALTTGEQPGFEEDREQLDLEAAMRELGEHNTTIAAVAELKLFGGMTKEEIARECDISTATVVRHWRFARAWLSERLSGQVIDDD